MNCFKLKSLIFSAVLFFAFASPSFAQNTDVDVVKQRAALNSAKADLEEVRKKRDMAVAARWKDKETSNQERELFNEKYQENKEKVDALMSERTRLFEDVRVAREDLAQVKLEAEKARAEFLSLAPGAERLETLSKYSEQGVPFKIPERIEVLNKVKKEMSLYKDDPLRIAKSILNLAEYELEFSREIKFEKKEVLLNNTLSEGSILRLGALFAMEKSDNGMDSLGNTPSALMLPVAGEKKRVFSWQENLTPEAKVQVKNAFANLNDSLYVMVPVDVLLSTELSSELANHQETTFKEELYTFFKNGGILMYPIVAILVLGLLTIIYRFIWLIVFGFSGLNVRKSLKALKNDDIETAKKFAEKSKGGVGKVLKIGLLKTYADRKSAEHAFEELFASYVPKIEKGLSWISVFAATAPLLGLLGTVMGMIELFDVITMHGTSDPKLLAGGISIALTTTEAGLIVAIPLQLLHTFLTNKADALRGKMEKVGLMVLNALFIKEK